MTFQPPPPPPGGTPPPPPGGGAPARFDPKAVNPLDWGIVAAGVLTFLFSFIAFYDGVTVEANGRSQDLDTTDTASAWHDVIGGGFFAWFAMVFAVLGAVVVAMALFAPHARMPIPHRLAGLGLFALATVFEIIAIFVTPGDSTSYGLAGGDYDVSANHGFGFWASLIFILAGLVLSLMRFQATGGQLPGNLGSKVPNVGGYGPQGGIGGQQGTPPPPAGGPPPPPPAGGTPPPSSGYGPPQ